MITQLGIAILGTLAMFLTQQSNVMLKKYACLFGLASQPFFLYSTFTSALWGLFFVSIVATGVWMLGLYNYWVKPPALQPAVGCIRVSPAGDHPVVQFLCSSGGKELATTRPGVWIPVYAGPEEKPVKVRVMATMKLEDVQ